MHRSRFCYPLPLTALLLFMLGIVPFPVGGEEPEPGVVSLTLADLIASAGHGEIFDPWGQPIDMTDEMVSAILGSMMEVLSDAQPEDVGGELMAEAQAMIEDEEMAMRDKALIQAAVVDQMLSQASDEMKSRYDWRHRLLLSQYADDIRDNSDLMPEMAAKMGLGAAVSLLSQADTTDYIARCQAQNVPIPPPFRWPQDVSIPPPADWPGTNEWKYHGQLSSPLILSEEPAYLFAYADPNQRGGCIALPRGGGQGAAGIICQSATTGAACIWDNIPQDQPSPIGWAPPVELDVSELRNGDTLVSNCTFCHRGNNVFIISPDDPAWGSAIRVPWAPTFTTQVENPQVARYVPISSQSGWENPMAGQCIGCHERPAYGFMPPPNPMPPGCRTSLTNPAGCYESPFPDPPFSTQIRPVTARSAQGWAGKLLSTPTWAKGHIVGSFDSGQQAMTSFEEFSSLQTVIVSAPSSPGPRFDPTDVVSYVAVSGAGASLVDVAVYSSGTGSNFKYQGWNGSRWTDAPATDVDGVYWYRAEIQPSATVFYAKTYRATGSSAPPFSLWAFRVRQCPVNTSFFVADSCVESPSNENCCVCPEGTRYTSVSAGYRQCEK